MLLRKRAKEINDDYQQKMQKFQNHLPKMIGFCDGLYNLYEEKHVELLMLETKFKEGVERLRGMARSFTKALSFMEELDGYITTYEEKGAVPKEMESKDKVLKELTEIQEEMTLTHSELEKISKVVEGGKPLTYEISHGPQVDELQDIYKTTDETDKEEQIAEKVRDIFIKQGLWDQLRDRGMATIRIVLHNPEHDDTYNVYYQNDNVVLDKQAKKIQT